jgi:16S rRNA processing protein RimM
LEIIDVGSLRNDYVVVGKIIKAHGIKGDLKVFPYSGFPDDFDHYSEVILADEGDNQSQTYEVVTSRSHGKVAIVHLAGIDSMNDSEALRGFEVRIAKDDLPELEPGFYYWHELQGMEVITDQGESVGILSSLMATSGHSVLVIKNRGREHLVPAIKEFVVGLDEKGKSLVISPSPGLLEMNY